MEALDLEDREIVQDVDDVSADSSPEATGSTGQSQSSASSSSQPDEEFTPSALGKEPEFEGELVFFDKPKGARISVQLPSSTLVNPKSVYDGYQPPLPPTREHVAVAALMTAARAKPSRDSFVDFELSDFSFYTDARNYPMEMRSLHQFSTKVGHDKFYFDGVLSDGGTRHYVTRVEVCELPIGNYGTEHASVDDQIWVRSVFNRKREVYYRLTNPAHEYKRFFHPFLWVANLAKHFVDFSAALIDENRQVHMGLFREEFFQWLAKTHGEPALKRWLVQHPSHDFRTSIMANLSFIWKEANGVLGDKAASLSLFREAMFFKEYPEEPTPAVPVGGMVRGDKGEEEYPTIVTPYIMECFGHMVIGKMLRLAGEDAGMSIPSFPVVTELGIAASTATSIPDIARRVQVGDVISTPRDGEDSGTKWKPMASRNFVDDGRWFGLVQKVHMTPRGRRSFDVAWLYRPSETPCCVMKYPWPNELFLSDHCTCEEGASARVQELEVIDIHPINWFGNPNDSGRRLFIRQLYMVEERRWVTLQPSHLQCAHEQKKLGYKVGDTLLASLSDAPGALADPLEVILIFKQATSSSTFVRLRKFRRRASPDAPKNELIWTEELIVKKTTDFNPTGKCHIRFFASTDSIPSPYNRGGTGNLFFITHQEADGKCVPFNGEYPPFKQGFDPRQEVTTKLKGLDLFCGAGNFGRGLEDGGVVDMRWTNDIWDRAIHTYMANQPGKDNTHAFLGSVDFLLQAAIEGKFSEKVPRPGEVDFISAGSPCPGFSLLTQDKTTLHQVKNQSLVASFASFVDFYRPKYGVLENVASIVQAKHNRKEDVLSQLFCALIGMGYQAQLILGDAWAHGAPQSRTRVFLYFAAPGLRLPEAPLTSHSHFPGANSRGLGEMCNGEPFVQRSFEPTAFKYVSAGEAAGDLPEIGDAKPDSCVAFPDHRVSAGMTSGLVRGSSSSRGFGILYQIPAIPIHPYGLNFAKAWNGGNGVMSKGDRALFPEESLRVSDIAQGWSRVHPRLLFQTVTTSAQPTCARTGSGLHWNQPRPLSLMEVRRAQGFLDDEVLVGSTAEQWKLVGNSVARPMALALGLKFREAWLGSLYDGHEAACQPRPVVATTNIQAIVDRAKSISGSTTPSEYFSVVEDMGVDELMGGDEFTPLTVVSDLEVSRRKRTISREPSTAVSERPVKVRRQLLDEEDPKKILLSRREFKSRGEDQARRESSQSRSRSQSRAPGSGGRVQAVVTTTTITTTTALTTTTTFTTRAPVTAEPTEEEPRKINGMTIIRID